MLQTLHRLFFLISFFLIRLINIQFNFTVQTFQLPAGTKGLNTWEQLGCRSINQGDPGVSIPAVLCCPEAKKSWDFLYSFLILSVSVTDSVGSPAETRNGAVDVLWELQGWEPQGCWGDMEGGWALPQGALCRPHWPLHQVNLGLRHRYHQLHLQRCSAGQTPAVQPRLISQLAEGDRQFKDVSHLTPYI